MASVDGSIVYVDTAIDIVAQVTTEGLRVSTVLAGPASDTEFVYDFDAKTIPVLNEDGSVDLTQSVYMIDPGTGLMIEAVLTIAQIQKPWAKDANGLSVPTRYKVADHRLTQIVEHTSGQYAYPVVADPQLVWEGILPWFYFNRLETHDLTNAGNAAALCAGLAFFFGPIGLAAAAICAANIGSVVYNANYYQNRGQCVKLHFAPVVVFSGGHSGALCN